MNPRLRQAVLIMITQFVYIPIFLLSSHPSLGYSSTRPNVTKEVAHGTDVKALEKIRSSIDDFIKMYEAGGIVHDCLQRISVARHSSCLDPETWAKQWALQLRIGDEAANNLDKGLFYTLCNRWKGIKGDATITED